MIVGHPLTLYLPLSCPQISTAYIMTSQLSALAGGLSFKKAKSYYFSPNKVPENKPYGRF